MSLITTVIQVLPEKTSQHEQKYVDWDIKHQLKQIKITSYFFSSDMVYVLKFLALIALFF